MDLDQAVDFLSQENEKKDMAAGRKPFSETALRIWKSKYAAKGEQRPRDTNIRIVEAIDPRNTMVGAVLYNLLCQRLVAFNSPVYFNLGVKENPQCSACFILGVDDSMDSIASLAATEMNIFRQGSGAGANYSALRANGAPLSNGGIASGPVSFLRSLDAMAGAIKSGGKTRRAARIAILDADHPDIEEFIQCKAIEETKLKALASIGMLPEDHFDNPAAFFQNTNHTVRLSDDNMLRRRDLVRKIAEATWHCGDPAVHFSDTVRAALDDETRDLVHASNPCDEFVFVDNSACNLASINVAHGYLCCSDSATQMKRLRAVASVLAWAMDRIIDISSYPTKEIRDNVLKYRPLGMGFTGFGERCMRQGVRYGSAASESDVGAIAGTIDCAVQTVCPDSYQTTAIAPTGTISLFLDAESTGIEPVYAPKVMKYCSDDKPILQEPECVAYAKSRGWSVSCATGENAVTPTEHINIVAAAQPHVSGGISKTVNLPHDATVDEIEALIYYAWESKVKAISFYRDGSKAVQPLVVKKEEQEEQPDPSPAPIPAAPSEKVYPVTTRIKLPHERKAITRKFNIGGEEGYITVGLYETGAPGEVFIKISKVGSTLQGFIDQLGIAWSMALQHGVPLAALVEKGKGSRFDPSGFTGDDIRSASSVVDYLAKWLEKRFLQNEPAEDEDEDEPEEGENDCGCAGADPEATHTRQVIRETYDCPTCRLCGGLTLPSGTCYVCQSCGETTGCS